MTDDCSPTELGVQPTFPVGLLALGLGPVAPDVDLEGEIDLEDFLCTVPELELHGCLGRGGMGLVYRARQTRLDRIVAVKLMVPELATDPEFVSRFEREARALARLDHPGVVRVHDFGEGAGVCYLVMEYVEGTNLRALMEEGLDAEQAAVIIGQLCDALAYAHGRGVVHRDIKPENVLIDRQGRVKVADFGLAKLHQDMAAPRATGTRRVVGTPQYMAPEQIGDPRSVDHRADIFAIGVVFYEMLTGQLPVGRFPSPSELGHGDARLDEIVLRSLESNREKRFQAASEIRDALATPGVNDPALATVVGESSRSSRALWIAAAGGSVAVAVVRASRMDSLGVGST
jgi:serine/threonine protein kinase